MLTYKGILTYKGVKFDDYTETDGNYWAEICSECAKKYHPLFVDDIDDGSTARGYCSVAGCTNNGEDAEYHYYIDFDIRHLKREKAKTYLLKDLEDDTVYAVVSTKSLYHIPSLIQKIKKQWYEEKIDYSLISYIEQELKKYDSEIIFEESVSPIKI